MAVTHDSYEAAVLGYAIAMLAGSATFRTLVGAATDAAAKAFIIEVDGGEELEAGVGKAIACDGSTLTFANSDGKITKAYAQVASLVFPAEQVAVGWERREGEVAIAIVMPATSGDKPHERTVRALNVLGAIRSELRSQLGAAGKLAAGSVDCALRPIPESTGALRGCQQGILTIRWRNH